jgi:hypothetical protein
MKLWVEEDERHEDSEAGLSVLCLCVGTSEAVTDDTTEPSNTTECTPCDCSSVATDTTETTTGTSEGMTMTAFVFCR